jgi:2-iminobutanoate/2-iminopropanoate deaminase
MKRIIVTDKSPKAIGPYSQAVESGSTLYITGQIALDPVTNVIVEGGIREQTEQVMKNLGLILTAAGYSFADVVKTTCMLTDINDFSTMNDVYAKYFEKNFPARTTFQVPALPKNALIEIEVIATKK